MNGKIDNIHLICDYVSWTISQMDTHELEQFVFDRFFDECSKELPDDLIHDIKEFAPHLLDKS